jgi:hypothetical protein
MKNFLTIFLICTLFSCNRKAHTERTEKHEVNIEGHLSDSLKRVIKTLSEAYESLLQSTSSTDVVFSCPPCDSNKVSAAGMPHIINEVKINADGSKEFKGNISGYKENATLTQKINQARQSIIDSMSRIVKRDTIYQKAQTITSVRTVKTVVFPWYLVVGFALFGALWINERFNLFKIPFLTKK